MRQVVEATSHTLAELSEEDFRSLIFLQSQEVALIMPIRQDRRLQCVAERAIGLSNEERKLSSNWNIEQIEKDTKQWLSETSSSKLPKLLLRDTRKGEKEWAPNGWYLQDGAHRSLGFLMAVMRGHAKYAPQLAYCAKSRL